MPEERYGEDPRCEGCHQIIRDGDAYGYESQSGIYWCAECESQNFPSHEETDHA